MTKKHQGVDSAQLRGEAFDSLLTFLNKVGAHDLEALVRQIERAMQDFEERIGNTDETEPLVRTVKHRIHLWHVRVLETRSAETLDPQLSKALREEMLGALTVLHRAGTVEEAIGGLASIQRVLVSPVDHPAETQTDTLDLQRMLDLHHAIMRRQGVIAPSLKGDLLRVVRSPAISAIVVASFVFWATEALANGAEGVALRPLFLGVLTLILAAAGTSIMLQWVLRRISWKRALAEDLSSTYSATVFTYLQQRGAL